MEQGSGYSAAWSSAFDWGSKGPEFKSPYPDHFFLPWFQGEKNMKPEKASLHGSTEPLHTAQPCFMHRRCASYIRLFRWSIVTFHCTIWSISTSFRYEAFAPLIWWENGKWEFIRLQYNAIRTILWPAIQSFMAGFFYILILPDEWQKLIA